MAIIVDNDTRLVVQGLTGREGRFHGLRNRNYGTNAEEGRRLLEESDAPIDVEPTMLDAAKRAVELVA